MIVRLLVDLKSLLEKALLYTSFRNLFIIILVQTLNVVHQASLVGLGCCEHEQVLQCSILAERRRLKNDLLQKFDELCRKIGFEEGLDGNGDPLWLS